MSVMLSPRETLISPGDLSTGEVVLLRCGSVAPGAVHDPCQHSVIVVQCCECAGCMLDVWSCTADYDQPAWYEPEALAKAVDPLLRHPVAAITYAAITAIGAMSQVIETLTHIARFAAMAAAVGVGFGAHLLLR